MPSYKLDTKGVYRQIINLRTHSIIDWLPNKVVLRYLCTLKTQNISSRNVISTLIVDIIKSHLLKIRVAAHGKFYSY